MSPQHPLDPATPAELSSAVTILKKHHGGDHLRFKLIDIHECAKSEVIAYLESKQHRSKTSRFPDRRARIYYHKTGDRTLQKAIVNLTKQLVESTESLPDAQGPVQSFFSQAIDPRAACIYFSYRSTSTSSKRLREYATRTQKSSSWSSSCSFPKGK